MALFDRICNHFRLVVRINVTILHRFREKHITTYARLWLAWSHGGSITDTCGRPVFRDCHWPSMLLFSPIENFSKVWFLRSVIQQLTTFWLTESVSWSLCDSRSSCAFKARLSSIVPLLALTWWLRCCCCHLVNRYDSAWLLLCSCNAHFWPRMTVQCRAKCHRIWLIQCNWCILPRTTCVPVWNCIVISTGLQLSSDVHGNGN